MNGFVLDESGLGALLAADDEDPLAVLSIEVRMNGWQDDVADPDPGPV